MSNFNNVSKKKLKSLILEEMDHLAFGEERKEGNPVDHIRKTREKVEETVANLEDLLNMVNRKYSDKTDWVEGIVEEQKDVYQELMDLETELRTRNVNEQKVRKVIREKVKNFLYEKASEEYCKNTPKSEMGFTQKASCKAQGYIARSDGEKKKSDKYK